MWSGCINSGIFCTDDQAFCAYSIQRWKKRLPVGISDHFSGKKIVGDDRPSLHFSALFLFITPSRVMEAVYAVFSKIICVPEMSSVCCTVTGKSMNSIDLCKWIQRYQNSSCQTCYFLQAYTVCVLYVYLHLEI